MTEGCPPTSAIPGVVLRPLGRFEDQRGWLSELYRDDELPDGFRPVMGYLSVTKPRVARAALGVWASLAAQGPGGKAAPRRALPYESRRPIA